MSSQPLFLTRHPTETWRDKCCVCRRCWCMCERVCAFMFTCQDWYCCGHLRPTPGICQTLIDSGKLTSAWCFTEMLGRDFAGNSNLFWKTYKVKLKLPVTGLYFQRAVQWILKQKKEKNPFTCYAFVIFYWSLKRNFSTLITPPQGAHSTKLDTEQLKWN